MDQPDGRDRQHERTDREADMLDRLHHTKATLKPHSERVAREHSERALAQKANQGEPDRQRHQAPRLAEQHERTRKRSRHDAQHDPQPEPIRGASDERQRKRRDRGPNQVGQADLANGEIQRLPNRAVELADHDRLPRERADHGDHRDRNHVGAVVAPRGSSLAPSSPSLGLARRVRPHGARLPGPDSTPLPQREDVSAQR